MIRAALMLSLTIAMTGLRAEESAPARADTFEREALAVLRASHARQRSIVVHVNGEAVTGIVKAIGPDVVVLVNREYERVVVRRDRIDAIQGD